MIAIAQGRIARVVWYVIPLQTLGNTATLPEFEGLKVHQLLDSIKPITQQIPDFFTQHTGLTKGWFSRLSKYYRMSSVM